MDIDIFSAFIVGLLGSGHCLGMCGGITTMLTSAIKPNTQTKHNIPIKTSQGNSIYADKNDNSVIMSTANIGCSPQPSTLSISLFYHLGRIFSYAFVGAIVGFTGSIAAKNLGVPIAGLRLIAAVFLILLGLYIGQWLFLLNKVEALGKRLWQYLSPLSKKVIPVDSRRKALSLGIIWGWLPCGLVYSTLMWSLASGNALSGANIMLFFGLGTLPALLALSLGAVSIKNLLVNMVFRKTVAFSLIGYGIYSFIVAYQLMF